MQVQSTPWQFARRSFGILSACKIGRLSAELRSENPAHEPGCRNVLVQLVELPPLGRQASIFGCFDFLLLICRLIDWRRKLQTPYSGLTQATSDRTLGLCVMKLG